MRCLVTAGPTFEPLDQVRLLTNRSTGRLGTELAVHLAGVGHDVTLLRGALASWPSTDARRAGVELREFTTTADLRTQLESHAGASVQAVFHAAAVSDFTFGRILEKQPDGELSPVQSGKLETRGGPLWAQLVPTPKLITGLRTWFPAAWLVGWKFEVGGNQAEALARAWAQIRTCRTHACVANGPAYGPGFGLVRAGHGPVHCPAPPALYAALADAWPAPLEARAP
jgi:phosphopantothenoylcysteine decarboxylase/phosphopantothenate--cysteine ligase